MNTIWFYVVGIAALLVIAVSTGAVAQGLQVARDEYEIISVRSFPNAQKAFSYGEMHFDASTPGAYDLGLANTFFLEAKALDPQYPYVNHELARISFLRGEYDVALLEINLQIQEHGNSEPNSYYVRGLIEGYMGDYADAVNDYAYFLTFDPNDWAAMNDEAWVLLKAGRFQDAVHITARGLAIDPQNPWLLNSNATALYDLGEYRSALAVAQKAQIAVAGLTPAQWSQAYPGNDPSIGGEGVASFQQAVADNVHTISLALASSTVQLP